MLVFTVLSRTPELAKMAERLGIIDGQPFLIGENGTFDHDVNAFLRSLVDPSRPGRNTWRTYAYHLARFLCWLAQQQIACRAVDRSVLRLYYTQRRFSQKGPVSARTWNNIAAALTRFYEWAAMPGEIAKSPITYRDIRSGRMTAAPGTQQVRSAMMHVLHAVFRYIAEDRENAVAILTARERPTEVWLSESGRPMKTARWHAVFRRASQRSGVSCTPHILRHAFAIHQLTAMIQRLLTDPAWATASQPPILVELVVNNTGEK